MSDTKTIRSISDKSQKRLDILRDEKGRLLLTDDQKRAVLERGSILVSASAGSGKTSTMIKRIILMIAEGATLRRMLILVYNNSAADELKDKLHHELFKCACSQMGELRERFRKELDELSFCHICTIHAYCQSLIRENFDKLGLSPTFEVLDEGEHAVYMNEALDDVIADYSQRGDSEFLELVEVFSQSRKDDNLKNNIIKLHKLMEIQPDKNDFISCVNECYDSFENSKFFEILKRYYVEFFTQAKPIFEQVYQQTTGYQYLNKHALRLENAIALCSQIISAKDINYMMGACNAYEDVQTRINPKASPEEKIISDNLKGYFSKFNNVIDELKSLYEHLGTLKSAHEQNGRYVHKIVEVCEAFSRRLCALKEERNVLSFEDLQHKAFELLEMDDNPKEDFDAVFVDEYQDVNPTQEAIIRKMIKGECFMVGDVKQSIYGFRLADPTIFISRQLGYAQDAMQGTNIYFNRNFRSAYGILNFVNGVFDSVMTKKSADIDYKQEARFELKDIAPVELEGVSPEGYVQLHLFVEPKAKSESASGLYDITKDVPDEEESASIQEGRFIANEIKRLVGKAIGTSENGEGKRIGYGDIAVLFRGRMGGAREIIPVLKQSGIPVNEGAFCKSETLPERELMALLRVLDNPMQDIPLAGYLLSFFGGYDESEVAQIASLNGANLYTKLLCMARGEEYQGSNLSQKASKTLDILDDYRLKASFKNLSELMNDIISDYCYDAYLMRKGEGEVYALKSFVQSASKLDMTLGKFVESYCESGDKDKGATGGDRVVVSTFHGYKGLENPIVFLADTAHFFNNDASKGDLILSGKGFGESKAEEKQNNTGLIGINAFDFDEKTKSNVTLSKIAVSKCIKANQLKEEIRLFYVAMTRAKQLMYITASVSENKSAGFGKSASFGDAGCDLDFISNAVFEGSIDCMPIRHFAGEEDEIVQQSDIVSPVANSKLVEKIKEAEAFEYPYKEATSLAMKYSVSALDSIDDDAVKVFVDSAKLGTAYHKVMQYIDYFASGEEQVKAQIAQMVQDGVLDEEEAQKIKPSEIARCLDSDIMSLAREAEKKGLCMREKSFMMYKSASEVSDAFSANDKVLVQGVIDLFINDDKKYIVDFKNSALRDEETIEKYRKQLYLYKSAVESAICAKIDGVMLYSFKTGKTIVL